MTMAIKYELITGEWISIQYEFLPGDPEVGQPDGFEIYVANAELTDITMEISDADYKRIKQKCIEDWEEYTRLSRDEGQIYRWEAGNE